MPTVHLQVTGKVQGVFYRAAAKKFAEQTGVNGWIKNMPDGSVEATVNGSEEAVHQFIEWCKKGPSRAVVAQVVVTPKPDDGLTGFQIMA